MPRGYGVTNAAPYASAPAVGAAGDTYFNTTSKMLYVSDGTAWWPSGATIDDGYAESATVGPVSATGAYDILTVTITAVSVPTVVRVSVNVGFGGDAGSSTGTVDVWRYGTNSATTMPQYGAPSASPANGWVYTPIVNQWNVAASGNPGFKVRFTLTASGGNTYIQASVTWSRRIA
jgi:hypothetical protein